MNEALQSHSDARNFGLQPPGVSTVGVPAPPVADTEEPPADGPQGGRWISLSGQVMKG